MAEQPTFTPGIALAAAFYTEAVRPILDHHFPALRYDAALIGYGSDVIGFDDARSTDHMWGPRLYLFLDDAERADYEKPIDQALRRNLPYTFRGYSVNFSGLQADGVRLLEPISSGEVNHLIFIHPARGYLRGYLGHDLSALPSPADWLTFSSHKLLTLTAGAIFHNGLGVLDEMRSRLAYYPRDVWLYLMAASWARIGQEEPFVGRCGEVGDEIGSAVVAARLVRDVMRLCYLIARQYAPYSKWFGTGFARLPLAAPLVPLLSAALTAPAWQTRERHLCAAYEYVAGLHNALNIGPALPAHVSPFHGRPFMVIHGERFAEALKAEIRDPNVRQIAAKTLIGGIDHFSDSTDLLESVHLRPVLLNLFSE